MQVTYDRAKFEELVLYIAAKCQYERRFGNTKLHKILFFSDFAAFAKRGKPITGADYQKLKHGPAARPFLPAVDSLIARGDAAIQYTPIFSYHEKRLIALRDPDLSLFTAEEIVLVDLVIDRLREATAKEVSEMSHTYGGWRCAELNETIPYATALVLKRAPTQDEIDYGRQLAIRLAGA